MFDEQTGHLERRHGLPELRLLHMGPSFLAPCRDKSRGCAKGTPENPRSLWPENERCYQHYLECAVTGSFPDDPMVKRNAAIIREIEKEIARDSEKRFRQNISEIAEVLLRVPQ